MVSVSLYGSYDLKKLSIIRSRQRESWIYITQFSFFRVYWHLNETQSLLEPVVTFTGLYRVSYIETNETKLLWGVEGLTFFLDYAPWCLVASGGLGIWVSSTSFQKNIKGWPQQAPTEKVLKIHENLDFWWSIPQKGTGISHFGARYNPTIRIRKFFEEIGL